MSIRIGVSPLRGAMASLLMLSAVSGCGKPAQEPAASGAAPAASAPAAAPAAVAKSAAVPVFDENFLKNEPKKYSQFREEVVIRYYFKDRKGGFFLDVGSAEPILESCTHYLANELGWSGIAIDARAELASQYAKERPSTRFFSYLVTDHTSESEKFYLSGRLSSGNADHLQQFGVSADVKPKEIEVASITLNDLLTREKVEHIDFMNMDIEGFEPPALAGFDIDKYSPTLVCIESAPKTREPILKYFTDHGYRRMDEFLTVDSVNWYFEKKKP